MDFKLSGIGQGFGKNTLFFLESSSRVPPISLRPEPPH